MDVCSYRHGAPTEFDEEPGVSAATEMPLLRSLKKVEWALAATDMALLRSLFQTKHILHVVKAGLLFYNPLGGA